MQIFFLKRLWRFLKSGHLLFKLHLSAPPPLEKAKHKNAIDSAGGTCQNLGKHAPPILRRGGGLELSKILIFGCQIFVTFLGRLCKSSDIFGGGDGGGGGSVCVCVCVCVGGGGGGVIKCKLFYGSFNFLFKQQYELNNQSKCE